MGKERYVKSSYSLLERILRLAVYRLSGASNSFESFLIRLYVLCSSTRKAFCPKRAEKTLSFLKKMGAKELFVSTEDGEHIHALIFKASEFEKVVEQQGGKWVSVDIEGKTRLALIDEKGLASWVEFEKDLCRFGWYKKNLNGRDYFVTSVSASKTEDSKSNLFLHVHSNSVAMTMITKRIGFYLGAKQDICLFDPRGTWKSSGIPTESGYYKDIEAVYKKIVIEMFPTHRLWLSGYCSGAYPAAYLWKKIKDEKDAHLILENTAADLLFDFVSSLPKIPRWFASKYWHGLKSKNFSSDETGFSLTECFKDVKVSTKNKILVIYPENDQRISDKAHNKLIQLASQLTKDYETIVFRSTSADPHADTFFQYNECAEKFFLKVGTGH